MKYLKKKFNFFVNCKITQEEWDKIFKKKSKKLCNTKK